MIRINKKISIWLFINICILLYGINLYNIHPDGTIVLVGSVNNSVSIR